MIRKRFFAALIGVGMMICAFVAQAEIKTYTGVGEDYANQFETQKDAKLRAKRIAIEDAKKHAGVGLKTYSRTVNSELVDDEISTITSNSYKIVGDVKYEQILKPLTDRITVIVWRATVDVDVDDSEVKAWARRTADEKKALINRNRAAEEAFNENIKSADDLKRRAAGNLTEIEEFDLKHEVEALNNDFQVNQKIEDGNRLNYEEKSAEALEKYGEASKMKFFDGVGEYMASVDEDLEIAKQHSFDKAKQEATKNVLNVFINKQKDSSKIYLKSLGIELSDEDYSLIDSSTEKSLIEAEKSVEVIDVKRQIIPVDESHLLIRTYVRIKMMVTLNADEIEKWIADRK